MGFGGVGFRVYGLGFLGFGGVVAEGSALWITEFLRLRLRGVRFQASFSRGSVESLYKLGCLVQGGSLLLTHTAESYSPP